MSISMESRVSLTIDMPTAARIMITTKGHLKFALFTNAIPARIQVGWRSQFLPFDNRMKNSSFSTHPIMEAP
jgi:hypothetical protein